MVDRKSINNGGRENYINKLLRKLRNVLLEDATCERLNRAET